jgi:hypothetical protein
MAIASFTDISRSRGLKKLGLNVTSEIDEKRGRIIRLLNATSSRK